MASVFRIFIIAAPLDRILKSYISELISAFLAGFEPPRSWFTLQHTVQYTTARPNEIISLKSSRPEADEAEDNGEIAAVGYRYAFMPDPIILLQTMQRHILNMSVVK